MFNTRQKLIASTICHIFETSKPLGNSTTVVVLNDGAGITYGIPQATHKSGNLLDIVERYLTKGENLPNRAFLLGKIPLLRRSDKQALILCASDIEFKRILKELGGLPEMRAAQLENVWARMNKAERACIGSGFITTMALAVIYDSMNHGSWEKIRDKTYLDSNKFSKPLDFEKAWIKEYVENRDAWLESIPRLAPTDYRTDFFIDQIKRGNWNLNLPMNVHGFNLTENYISQAEGEISKAADLTKPAAFNAPATGELQKTGANEGSGVVTGMDATPAPSTDPPDGKTVNQQAENIINAGEVSAEEAKIAEAKAQPPVELPQSEPTDFIGKVKKTAIGVLTGTISLPFLDKFFGIQLTPEQIELMKVIFPWLFIGTIIALIAWFVTKKINNFHLTKLIADKNADVTSRNVKLVQRIPKYQVGLWRRVQYAVTAKPSYIWMDEEKTDPPADFGE